MTKRIVAMALLVTLGFGGVITVRGRELNAQLAQKNIELGDAKLQLAEAKKKLEFLESAKTRVQVTAYALTDDFGRARDAVSARCERGQLREIEGQRRSS